MLYARTLAICAFGFVCSAHALEAQGLSQYRNFELGTDLASVSTLAGVASSSVAAVERLFFRRRVAFTLTSLLLPKPWSFWQEEAIDYQAITGLDVSKVAEHGPRCLYLTHEGGRREIPEAMVPSRAAFEEVCALLTARVRASEQMGPAEAGAAADGGGLTVFPSS